MVYDIDIGL